MRGVGSSRELLNVRYVSNSYFSLCFAPVLESADKTDLGSVEENRASSSLARSTTRGLSRGYLYNIYFGPRTSRPTCVNSGFYIWACGGIGIHIGFKLRCRKD